MPNDLVVFPRPPPPPPLPFHLPPPARSYGFLFASQAWLSALLIFPLCFLAGLVSPIFDRKRTRPPTFVAAMWGRLAMLTMGVRPKVEGAELLPPEDEAVVFVANHGSYLDIPVTNFLPRLCKVSRGEGAGGCSSAGLKRKNVCRVLFMLSWQMELFIIVLSRLGCSDRAHCNAHDKALADDSLYLTNPRHRFVPVALVLQYLMKAELLWLPIVGWKAVLARDIFVHRQTSATFRKLLKSTTSSLKAGNSIMTFPGTEKRSGVRC